MDLGLQIYIAIACACYLAGGLVIGYWLFKPHFRDPDSEVRREKRKRCLALAQSCKNCAEMYGCMAFHEKLKSGKTPYYQKCSLHANIQICHKKKWLELAEKFKEG